MPLKICKYMHTSDHYIQVHFHDSNKSVNIAYSFIEKINKYEIKIKINKNKQINKIISEIIHYEKEVYFQFPTFMKHKIKFACNGQ